ncbi:schlafen-like protein 1 [Mercenaria mercenaria]|uniref:schlafen-like protein 1 n=1 Tax=Mercenaria mercenaria TaxID=6596 RepID=UPI00234F4A46|nr:schlafen-like protein 1 [Mercenaria mercenaria]XP_053382862.1 schlafen-like protein 1 [Mercenaria mercenaria]XP_053382863.1 schlafen-like protein 1 [Mercenaria mercenaria]XP_053382864.1 schlafen-like protein 1 [Mercenaria mercenaria]
MGRKKWRNRNNYDAHGGAHYQQQDAHYQQWDTQAHSSTSAPLRESYCLNEHLGSESRGTEFKNGPGFIRHGFRENVAKYVCGFVNSQENGKLLIGVNDDGRVSGYECSHHEEDSLRRDVDEAVKDLVPAIFPEDYSVRFVQVCNENGHRIGNIKVIEIIVRGAHIEVKDQLYQNKQGVFIRRDGSVQELKAHEIQEWTRRRYQGEMDKVRKNEGNLQSELQTKASELRQLEEKLQQKNDELRRKEMELDRQKSSLNHMSDKNRQLQDENNKLKQHTEQNGAQGNNQVIERLDKMEQMLVNNKKSKVCVIS